MTAVQIVAAHVVGSCDGQSTASYQLHYPSQVRFPVSKKLVEEQTANERCHSTANLPNLKHAINQQLCLSLVLSFCLDIKEFIQ